MRILVVCDGNICRSPMGEALLRQSLAQRKINGVEVTSGGLTASPFGVAHAQLRRVLGPAYRLVENRPSLPLTQELIMNSDLILGMENRHVAMILERFPEVSGRVHKITTYAGKEGEVKDFPDSGYGDVASWLRWCHAILVPCVEMIVDKIADTNRRSLTV